MAAALLAATSSTRAQTNWTGTLSDNWFTAGNWNAGVPTAATSANIDTVSPHATVVAKFLVGQRRILSSVKAGQACSRFKTAGR